MFESTTTVEHVGCVPAAIPNLTTPHRWTQSRLPGVPHLSTIKSNRNLERDSRAQTCAGKQLLPVASMRMTNDVSRELVPSALSKKMPPRKGRKKRSTMAAEKPSACESQQGRNFTLSSFAFVALQYTRLCICVQRTALTDDM